MRNTSLATPSIFGIYSGPIAGLAYDPDTPSHERYRCLLLDPAVRSALRDGAATRARVAPFSPVGTRRHPPTLASRAACPARGREAGDDRQPGDRTLSRAQVVRARPGALRRAVRAARRGARHREPRGRARGAGEGVRGDGWDRGGVWGTGGDRGGDQTRNAECGMRDAGFTKCGGRDGEWGM